MRKNIIVTVYLPISACYGLVIGGVNHTTSIRTCLDDATRRLSAQSTDSWTELDRHQKLSSFVCVMWHISSIGFLIHLPTFDNLILSPQVTLPTSVFSFSSHGWNLYISNVTPHSSLLILLKTLVIGSELPNTSVIG